MAEDYLAWVRQVCPDEMRGRGLGFGGGSRSIMPSKAFEHWFAACLERGFTVPSWPREYGGAGLDRTSVERLKRAMREVGAPPPLSGAGPTMLGSTLLELGTAQQGTPDRGRLVGGAAQRDRQAGAGSPRLIDPSA